MAEPYNPIRVVFARRDIQKDFIGEVKSKLDLSWLELGKVIKINPRTLTDWYREKFHMSLVSAVQMSKISKVPLPEYKIINHKDHLKSAAVKGGLALIKKQGRVSTDETQRRKRWNEWWLTKGRFNKNIIRLQTAKTIKIPSRSEDLAEFVGIMLGDGTVGPYSIAITLNAVSEADYTYFVSRLIKKLFGVQAVILNRKDKGALDVKVYRKRLVDFCQQIGLVKGDKIAHRVVIPEWIMRNNSFLTSCVRGLMDTDGSVFEHRYLSKGKMYGYKKVSFSSGSIALLKSIEEALKKLGFNVRMTRNRKEIVMDSQREVRRYIEEIGSHNPLRLRQIRKVAPNGKATVC